MASWPRVSRNAECYNLNVKKNNPRQWKDSGMSNISVNDVVKVFKRHRLDNGNLSVWSADGNGACVMVGAPHGNHILLEYLPPSSMQAALFSTRQTPSATGTGRSSSGTRPRTTCSLRNCGMRGSALKTTDARRRKTPSSSLTRPTP